jgi:hypothetical protein
MPRPDRGCCCDNSKSPDNCFCCEMDSYTDGRQTYPGCAASYTITWSNIQVFGAWDTAAAMPVRSPLNHNGTTSTPSCDSGCWGQDWGYSIKSNSVVVYKYSHGTYGDIYLPANEVSGTYAGSCHGLTTAIQGDIITRKCPNCTCSGTEACTGCFCDGTKDINFGNVSLRCWHPSTLACDGNKVFEIQLGWRSRATLASTYNSTSSDCDNSCGGGTPNWVRGCYCHPGDCASGNCGNECGNDYRSGTGGSPEPSSIIDPTAFVMEFQATDLAGNECPQGHTYSLTDWSANYMEAFGTVTVS